MKKYILFIILLAVIQFSACRLEEDPPFLSTANIFESAENAQGALDGVYNSIANWGMYGYSMHHVAEGWSGLTVFYQRINHPANLTLYSLKPLPNDKDLENIWKTTYQMISRANGIIAGIKPVDNPKTNSDQDYNDVLGQAYFLRAFGYFNLVNFWGDVPLRLEPVTTETIHKPLSKAKDVYKQIISDAENAVKYMYPHATQRTGYPGAEAANMLLAKVYMTLATANDEIKDGKTEAEYWQLAYNQAIQVYGKYSLMNDYSDLWGEDSGDNSQENIFEVQFNIESNSGIMRYYTVRGATLGNNTWGRLGFNAEIYDDHIATYPTDVRIENTFISIWQNVVKNKTFKVYPELARKKFNTAFPRPYKYWGKDPFAQFSSNNKNFIIYRYADLLLMLAEISNELQNGEQMTYVDEVLARVGLSHNDRTDNLYNQGQDGFREAIMKEYRYELLGEDQDWWNERRRGYQWFYNHVIAPHNAYAVNGIDLVLAEDEETVMYLPLPASEINTNEDID